MLLHVMLLYVLEREQADRSRANLVLVLNLGTQHLVLKP